MSASSASTLSPLVARLRAHLTSADQLASALVDHLPSTLDPASGDRKWIALSDLGDKPIKWSRLRRLAVDEFAVGGEDPPVWAVGQGGPVGGVQGVRALVKVLRRTAEGEGMVNGVDEVMELGELVVVLRGWLAGQDRRPNIGPSVSSRLASGNPGKAGPSTATAQLGSSLPTPPPHSLATQPGRPQPNTPIAPVAPVTTAKHTPVALSKLPLASGSRLKPAGPASPARRTQSWVVEVPVKSSPKYGPSPARVAQKAGVTPAILKPKVSLQRPGLGPPALDAVAGSYPTPDSSASPPSTSSSQSSGGISYVTNPSRQTQQADPQREAVSFRLSPDTEPTMASMRASVRADDDHRATASKRPKRQIDVAFAHGTLVEIDHWFGAIGLVWDRNWAEWDWFADRIIDKERLKPEPDSVVVVGVRRGANWSYFAPDQLRPLRPWPLPSGADPSTIPEVRRLRSTNMDNDAVDDFVEDWKAGSDRGWVQERLEVGRRAEQEAKAGAWARRRREEGAEGEGWDGGEGGSSEDEYFPTGTKGRRVRRRRTVG